MNKDKYKKIHATIVSVKKSGLNVKLDDGAIVWMPFSKYSSKLGEDVISSLFAGEDIVITANKSKKPDSEEVYWIQDISRQDMRAEEKEQIIDALSLSMKEQEGQGIQTSADSLNLGSDSGSALLSDADTEGKAYPESKFESYDDLAQEIKQLNLKMKTLLEIVEEIRLNYAASSDITDRELAESACRQATQLFNTSIAEFIDHKIDNGGISDVKSAITEIKKESLVVIPAMAEHFFEVMRGLPMKMAKIASRKNKE